MAKALKAQDWWTAFAKMSFPEHRRKALYEEFLRGRAEGLRLQGKHEENRQE